MTKAGLNKGKPRFVCRGDRQGKNCYITQKPGTTVNQKGMAGTGIAQNTVRPNCEKCNAPMVSSGLSKTRAGTVIGVRWKCRNTASGKQTCSMKRVKIVDNNPDPIDRKFDQELKSTRFVITSAQNGTPVDQKLWKSLQVYAKQRKAQILVVPFRYKNPTSVFEDSNEEIWAPELTPYLCNTRKELCPNLVLLGNVKVVPTATSPLTSLEGFTGQESSIVGHPKIQLRTIPVPAGKMPKVMWTTGAVTVKNYTDSKQGILGDFHHSHAALIVEVTQDKFFVRHLNATHDGSFIDLDREYTTTGSKPAPPALALATGDTHVGSECQKVVEATFTSPKSIANTLRPRHILWHDVMDGYSVNPHDAGNPFINLAKQAAGKNSVTDEIYNVCRFIDDMTPEYAVPVVVASNHDHFLSRWIVNKDWRQEADKKNAEFYLETALSMLRHSECGRSGASYPSPFVQWAKKLIKHKKLRLLKTDESFVLKGVEFGLHGDKGPNGSRGSIKNLSRIGTKTTVGHSHTPGIEGGCYQTGTSTLLRLGYNSGPSSWMNAHVIQYANGKRTIIFIIDGQWRDE